MNYLKLLLPLLLISICFCSFGIDMSTLTTLENLKCLRNQYSANFLITRAYKSFGAVDTNAKSMIRLARQAGIDFVDVYLFPCPTKDPIVQADEMLAEL